MTERADFTHRLAIALSLTPMEESWFEKRSEEILPRKKRNNIMPNNTPLQQPLHQTSSSGSTEELKDSNGATAKYSISSYSSYSTSTSRSVSASSSLMDESREREATSSFSTLNMNAD